MGTLTRDNFGPVFDADNHYWETSEAFTRHRDPKFRDRGLQIKEIDGAMRYVVKDQVFQGSRGPGDVAPRPAPGSLLGLFSGKTRLGNWDAFNMMPKEMPYSYDRETRLQVMDEQGIAHAWMFPSQACILEAPMLQSDDIEASVATLKALNCWIDEEWGFAYKNRIFGVPYMTLSDADAAVAELQWCIDRGARVVFLRHGPAVTADGRRSPAHPMFNRFWALAEEARVVVAFHGGSDVTDTEFFDMMQRHYGQDFDVPTPANPMGASIFGSLAKGRQVMDLAYMLVAHRLFERFPRLRVAFVEAGSHWVPALLHSLESLKQSGMYKEDPVEQFIEHCWVAPYPEENLAEFARHYPTERILFGSDWPHGEGFVHPRDFFENVKSFSDEDVRKIMWGNAHALTFG